LVLQTLYVPEHATAEDPIVAIESKVPFKNETEMKAGPHSNLVVTPSVESVDCTVVNERKIRVRASLLFGVKEYGSVDVDVFEGLKDEELQMRKEKIGLTEVAARKTESIDVQENFTLEDRMPEILQILKYDVSVVENHKQLTKEKAVINASVYCNVMSLGTEKDGDAEADSAAGEVTPVFYQGKTEFTQFIRLDGDGIPGDSHPAGSKVGFAVDSLNLAAKEDGNGKRNLLALDMSVNTELELYKNVEKEVVTDVYHHLKDLEYETEELGSMTLGGSGAAEVSAREIVNIPERYGSVGQVVFISGRVSEKRALIDQTRSIVEGVVTADLICVSADAGKAAFSVTQEIPFRSAVEIPGVTPEMTADNDIVLKELWFDKLNNKQIEVNASVLVSTAVSRQEKHHLVKSISFPDGSQDNAPLSGIVLYIARSGDNIWNIAKKYRTTIDELKRINDLESEKEIGAGTKLLITAKNH
jgi:LysM repeat protein